MAITHALVADGDPLVGAADWNDAHVVTAADIPIVDAADDFTATEVEGALAELQADAEAHAAAADPHTGYVREADANWTDLTDAGETTLHSHPGGGGNPIDAWPVGSIFIAVVSTNPNTLLGGGTWAAIAAGRMLIGLDSGDATMDTVEETGGEKTHTLTAAEIPTHTHPEQTLGTTTGASSGFTRDTSMSGSTVAVTPTTGSTGGGGAHNNLPPFFVVYMWKRTA